MEEKKNEVIQEATETQEESYKSGSVQYIDSREVAGIVEKEHRKLLRDIRNYIAQLTETNFGPSDFFIESSYKDASGKSNRCYLVTRKGCEFIAHKLTGVKGTKFTATYINRFHEMEDSLQMRNDEKFIKFMEQQAEFNKRVMENLMLLQDQKEKSKPRKTKIKVCESQFSLSERLRDLNGEFTYLSEIYGIERRTVMHKIYKILDAYLGQEYNLDVWLGAYREMTGRREACTIHAVAYFDELYEKAMNIMEDADKMERILA